MKTKNKNVVRNLLEIRADFHNETFGKQISWKSVNVGTKDNPNWHIDIYEVQFSPTVSFNYDIIGKIATVAMVNHWMGADEMNGRTIVKFHLY